MTDQPDENRLDESLRHTFSNFHLTPDDQVWAGIEQRIASLPPPPPRRRPLPLPWLLPLVGLLSLVAGWLLPRPAVWQSAPPTTVMRPLKQQKAATDQRVVTSQAIIRHPAAAVAAESQAARRFQPASPVQSTTTSPARLGPGQTTTRGLARATQVIPGSIAPAFLPAQPGLSGGIAVLIAAPRDSSQTPAAASPVVMVVANGSQATPTNQTSRVSAADSTPASVRPLVALERRALVQLSDSVHTDRLALLATLRAEQAELIRLRHHTDSLLLALGGMATPTPAVAAEPSAAADTTQQLPPTHRWSLSLTGTPERNYLQLQTATTDTLLAERRNHESGRKGINAAFMAEYQLTNRLSVGAGLGYSTFGAELRLTNRRTEISVIYNTTTTHSTDVFTSTNTVYAVREDSIPQLSPVFNQSGQVIGYDTVFIMRNDTVYTTIVQNDTIKTTKETITPLISKKEVTTYKKLQPNYRFVTLPVLLRYRLTTGNGRWWTDVAGGAQFQLFMGGTQLVTEDGRNYRTERIRPSEGLFRPLNVALMGSLAMNYALTPRLSFSVAPSLRWQALSVYKPETGLRQQPTATGLQFGVRWKL